MKQQEEEAKQCPHVEAQTVIEERPYLAGGELLYTKSFEVCAKCGQHVEQINGLWMDQKQAQTYWSDPANIPF